VAAEAAGTLLEREHELAELGKVLIEAQHGRGRCVLIQAAAGLGKTSLLRAASETAAGMGFACVRARASELERDFAYGCVRQLFEPALARMPGPERDRLFGRAAALARPLFAPAAAVLGFPLADTSFSMLHGLYWLINNLAVERPVVLTVDDLHWSDTESLRLLAYLAPRLDGLPVAVLASTRPEEGGAGELARLASAPETMALRLGPLTAGATATLWRRTFGDVASEFAAACHEATGGNPLFVEALLREV
jgi:predicted ATPase